MPACDEGLPLPYNHPLLQKNCQQDLVQNSSLDSSVTSYCTGHSQLLSPLMNFPKPVFAF